MDLEQRMQDLDARIAARRDALDQKLGLAPTEGQRAAPAPEADIPAPKADVPAPAASDSAPAPEPGPDGAVRFAKKGSCGRRGSNVLDDLDGGFDFFGLFPVPGIVVKILFVLFCIGAILSLLWAVRCLFEGWSHGVSWWLGDAAFDAFVAWLLWWLCTHKKN